ncbi:MAG TPA: PBP1A family penicillin-binding protein [Vicinamibacterales bacterium]|nr:PBP1A family penicillin-binding protein [Vicinamibacterales bacterium]
MEKVRQFVRYFTWCAAAAALIFCLGSLHVFANGLDQLTQNLELDKAPEASLVYDRHNNLVFSFASEDRTNVALDRVSPAMVSAVLTAEDRYFFRHAGMDVVGLARAAWVDLKARAVKQGGSTITQQLIRHVALTTDRNVQRKIKEALLALRVERRFDKRKILEAYLNRIYLGSGHYGVEAAARGYFAKPAADLTIAEGAMLAGIIPCPSVCSPRTSPNVAKSRRDTVLKAMLENAAITEREYTDAIASPVSLAQERHDPYTTAHPANAAHGADAVGLHFLEAVRRQVMEQFGAEDVLKGGLRIYTTIDMTLQRHAEEAIVARLVQLDKTHQLEGALVAIDPSTGHVLAMVGGRDFHTSAFNRAMQAKRQPGSAFKPLVFAAALEQGYTPSSQLTGMDTPIHTAQGAWLPSGEHEAASYTLRQALTVSSNRAAARVMQLVGVTTTQTYARRLGISSPLPPVPSLALGTGEVTLLDLTSAYGAFANSGIVAPHTLITRIEDRNGNLLWQSSLDRHPYRAVRPGTAYLISSMMADVMNRGTGSRARTEGFKLPAAGKTGTTDDYGDAWFVGYTPHLVAGVWFGYDEKKKIMNRGFAGTVAVPAWARFMMKATEGSAPDWFDMPSDVERISVCRKTGNRASHDCRTIVSEDGRSNVYEDYYLMGTGPYESCSGSHMDPVNPLGEPPTATTATTVSAVF